MKIEATRKLKEMISLYFMEAKNARHNDRKVAWVTSGGPVEVLYAMDVIPVYPENHGAMIGAQKMGGELCEVAEGRGYSPDLCSYFRTDIGQALTGKSPIMGLPEPDMLLCCNNICGIVTKWYEIQARYYNVPNFMVDTPFLYGDLDEITITYVAEQLKELAEDVEKVTGRPLDEEKLRETGVLADEAVRLWAECLDFCAHVPSPMSAFDTFIHMVPIVSMRGDKRAVEYYRILRDELADHVAKGHSAVENERYRLLWDNIPIWFKLRDLSKKLASLDACLVCATYTDSWASVPISLADGDPWRAMAVAYLSPYINCGLERRAEVMIGLMEKFKVHGFVLHSNRGCKAYSLGQYDLRRIVAERTGLPGVSIEADMTDERQHSDQQLNTRIEAFIESLEG